MPQRIIEAQSLKVDTVSGATITSSAVLRAAEAALKQATDNIDALKKPIEKKEIAAGETEAFDVVIVGGGIAGLRHRRRLLPYGAVVALDMLQGRLDDLEERHQRPRRQHPADNACKQPEPVPPRIFPHPSIRLANGIFTVEELFLVFNRHVRYYSITSPSPALARRCAPVHLRR
jgi:hypothetical protein